MMFNQIYSMIGHSPMPQLSLLKSGISENYTLFHTPDLVDFVPYLVEFSERNNQNTTFHQIPSLDSPSEIITWFKSFQKTTNSGNVKSGIMVTQGTLLQVGAMVQHLESDLVSFITPFTFHTDSRILKLDKENQPTISEFLASRGWELDDGTLVKGQDKIPVISVEILNGIGKITIDGRRFIEDFMHSPISACSRINQDFGVNGIAFDVILNEKQKKRKKGRMERTLPKNVYIKWEK
ncbi:MAG: hypothetical protein CMB13_00270 [Euryarchaeota archaeon]|nr:hypothetical protein [Euryarchaeota archaeon]